MSDIKDEPNEVPERRERQHKRTTVTLELEGGYTPAQIADMLGPLERLVTTLNIHHGYW